MNLSHVHKHHRDVCTNIFPILRNDYKMVTISAALPFEAARLAMLGFNHEARNAPAYQVSAQCSGVRLSY